MISAETKASDCDLSECVVPCPGEKAQASTGWLSTLLLCVLLSACAGTDREAYQRLVHRTTAEREVDLDQLAASTKANGNLPPYRKAIVLKAIAEAKLGLYGRRARQRYDAVGSWCTEFARWVYGHAGAYADPSVMDEFSEVMTAAELEELFARRGRWITKERVRSGTAQPGDYLPIDLNGDRSPNHSTIVVWVSPDKRWVYTIDGNNDHGRAGSRVYLKVRPYMTADGKVHPKINGVGKVWPPASHATPRGS